MIRNLSLLLFLCLLTAGCARDLTGREVRDLTLLPQDPKAYLAPEKALRPLVSAAGQEALAAAFLKNHFAAWESVAPLETTKNPFWALDWIGKHPAFAENLLPLDPARREALILQTTRAAYPSCDRRGISLRRLDVRALPTRSPLFNDPRKAGEGFPFDNLQHGVIPAGVPLRVTHLSADGAWAFIETALLYGWVPVGDLAWVDEDFMAAFKTGRYLALTGEETAVADSAGIYRLTVGIGALLPLVDREGDGYRVLIPVADRERRAHLVEGSITADRGGIFPLALTSDRVAELAEKMMGQPYGWGDGYAGRDCSGTLRDLFAPFGLWLPRNSSRQAQAGRVVPLTELPPRERETRLLAEGVPFATLVHLPGHILLYLGEREGRAAMLHTLWGIRTKDLKGREGRWLVGKTVITTLEPGLEAEGLFLGIGSLLERVDSMNFPLEPAGR
ncbi:MAG: SH3 domain-containing protein [Trichloromonas sp.]|jgi:hypothetical protein|nr:SH3 domain-containing protein [Trichloromonas sp.]